MNMVDLSLSYYHGLTTTLNSSLSDMALGLLKAQQGKPLDAEAFDVISQTASSVSMRKNFQLTNYSGTHFNLQIDREIGDPKHGPNPCLGPIDSAPFYAIKIFPGDGSTTVGLASRWSSRQPD